MVGASNGEPTARQQVTYILGCSHSGSTILTIALGTHSRIFAAGELTNLVRDAWFQHFYCSCGEPGDACPFWSEVGRQWTGRHGTEVLSRYVELQQRFERLRSLPRLFWTILCNEARFREYAALTATLFATIQQVSGADVIVDSSKSPARALALAATKAFDLSVVHLVRDPRGVVWSLGKPKFADLRGGVQGNRSPQAAHRSALSWLLINLLSSGVRHTSGVPSLVLRYEHYARFPRSAMQVLGQHLKLDLSEIGGKLEHGAAFRAEHCIAGNRVRMAESIRLSFDEQWRDRLPRRERWIVGFMTAWLGWLYAHKRAAGSEPSAG